MAENTVESLANLKDGFVAAEKEWTVDDASNENVYADTQTPANGVKVIQQKGVAGGRGGADERSKRSYAIMLPDANGDYTKGVGVSGLSFENFFKAFDLLLSNPDQFRTILRANNSNPANFSEAVKNPTAAIAALQTNTQTTGVAEQLPEAASTFDTKTGAIVVNFARGKSNLDDEDLKAIKDEAAFIKTKLGQGGNVAALKLEGLTDESGTDAINNPLAAERIRVVQEALKAELGEADAAKVTITGESKLHTKERATKATLSFSAQ